MLQYRQLYKKLLVDGLYLTSKGYEFIGDLVSQTIKN